MSATSKLSSKQGISQNPSRTRKDNENANPQGSLIIALLMIAALAAIGGIVFTFLKKRKSNSNNKELKDVNEE